MIIMSITHNQIRNLNTQEKQQMRRYVQSVFRRISKHRTGARNQYEQERKRNATANLWGRLAKGDPNSI